MTEQVSNADYWVFERGQEARQRALAEKERILETLREELTFPCDKCASPVPPSGAILFPLGCGHCEAFTCPTCGFILCATGPLDLEDRPFTLGHSGHGMYGHRTLAEQPKTPVVVKRRGR